MGPLYVGFYWASPRPCSTLAPCSYFRHGMYICIYQSLLRQRLTIHWSRYKCNEIGLRTAYLFGGATFSTSLGYLVESSILATMDGKLGYAAWRSGTRDKLIVKLIITILQVAVFHRRRYDMFNCTNRLLHGPRFPHHACIVADS